MAYGNKKSTKTNASLEEFRSGERRKKPPVSQRTPVPPKPNIKTPPTQKPPKPRGGR